MATHLNAVDQSREGELLRRYELSCEKLFFRHMDEVYRRRAEKSQRGEPAHTGGYFRPSADWFQEARESTKSQIRNPKEEGEESGESTKSEIRNPKKEGEESGVLAHEENGPSSGGGASTKSQIRNPKKEGEENGASSGGEHDLRNEPNGVGGAPDVPVLRNEANGVGGTPDMLMLPRLTEMRAAVEQMLSGQLPTATVAGQRRDGGSTNAVAESPSCRKRRERNRRNAERSDARKNASGKTGRKTGHWKIAELNCGERIVELPFCD